MKEWFAIFKSDFLQICSFHHAFPFLCPKQKSKSLFIALLALCKRPCTVHSLTHSFKKSGKKWLALSKQIIALLLVRSQKTSDSQENQRAHSPPCVCRLMMYVGYDVCCLFHICHLWCLSPYELCRVGYELRCLSHYDICCLLGLSHYDVCCL